MAWHHHGSDMPTSAWAVLHHTDQNGPNILKGSVGLQVCKLKTVIQKTSFNTTNAHHV